MSSGVVLSIHSAHARNIYAGTKRYEYRKRKPNKTIDYVALYETGNMQAITGVAKIAGILEDTPTRIWELTKSFAGISRDFFRSYFSGKRKAVAYCISEVFILDAPVYLSDIGLERAPQSFQYINELEIKKLLEREIENKKPLQPRFFVGGIHGAGKTSFVERIASEMGLPAYSASSIISDYYVSNPNKVICTNEVLPNQHSLVTGLSKTSWFVDGGILDGHFVLQTDNNSSSVIPSSVFRQLNLDAMFVLSANPTTITSRLKARDGIDWRVSLVEKMQENEIVHAKQVARDLQIPLSIIDAGETQK